MSSFYCYRHLAAALVLLLVAVTSPTLSCPDGCRCRMQGVVFCNERDLTSAPEAIPRNTKTLFLQQNLIQSSQKVQKPLEPLTSLQRLVLDKNSLVSFPDRLPVSLKSLSINQNGMKFVGRNALGPLTNLKLLSLNSNNITNAGFPPLVALTLRELFLNHNSLAEIPRGLPATLQVLSLSSNKISAVSQDVIAHMTSLQKLHLRSNLIQSVDGDLGALGQLSLLDLSNNQIREIPYKLPVNLSDFQLGSNRIRYIYKEKGVNTKGHKHGDLQSLKKLERFDVSGNQLESVETDSFKSLPITGRLSIGLENNPWRCDCNLKYLKRWLTSHTDAIVTSSESNIQCTTPQEFSQVAIGSMDLDTFRCTRISHAFTVDDVTSDGFSVTYDESGSIEAPYVKMWLMYGLAKCGDKCETTATSSSSSSPQRHTSDITATQWIEEYKVKMITSSRVQVAGLAARARHLVCVFSANQDPNRIGVDQCEMVTTLSADDVGVVEPGGATSDGDDTDVTEAAPRDKRVIPNWAIVTLSCVIAIAFIIAMFALVLWKVRNNKRHHHKRHHHRYHGGGGGNGHDSAAMIRMTAGSNNVAPFIMSRTTPPQMPPANIVDAEHEFDVALMSSRHKSPPPPMHHGGRKYPSDSCCYSDSHADSIETTATVTSLHGGGREYVTSSDPMYHPTTHHDVMGGNGVVYGGYHGNSSGVV